MGVESRCTTPPWKGVEWRATLKSNGATLIKAGGERRPGGKDYAAGFTASG